MPESINQRLNAASMDRQSAAQVKAVMDSMLTDIAALKTSLNQLITDYNANTNIVTDTTAAAVTLTTTS